jgi:hypothetical protein
VATLGCIAAYAAATGELAAWRVAALEFNFTIYGLTPSYWEVTQSFWRMSSEWHWYMVYAAVGAYLWWRSRERIVFGLLLALMLTCLGSAYAQRKGFGYHLGGVVPVFACFGAYFVATMANVAQRRKDLLSRAALIVVVLVAAIGLAKKVQGTLEPAIRHLTGSISQEQMLAESPGGYVGHTPADAWRAAEYVKRVTTDTDTVLVWDRLVMINTLSGRRSPTPFITSGMLMLANPPFPHADEWNRGLESVFEEHPPRIVFGPAADSPHYDAFLHDPTDSRALMTVRRALTRRYAFDQQFGDLGAYRLVR